MPLPYNNVFTHGDGSYSIINANCGTGTDSSTAISSFKSDDTPSFTAPYGDATWKALTCGRLTQETGADNTFYYVQQMKSSPYSEQLISQRKGVVLWKTGVKLACGSGTINAAIRYPTLGFDGSIYAQASATCGTQKVALVKISSATGAVQFNTLLPSGAMNASDKILPYDGGVAVTNGMSIYYVGNSGIIDTSKTMSPGGSSLGYSSITATGRTFMSTYDSFNKIHFYYKDLGSATIAEIQIPSNATSAQPYVYATPTGGSVIMFNRSSDLYFGYFDSQGTMTYEKKYSSDSQGNSAARLGSTVDDQGNFVIERAMDSTVNNQGDRNIYVDSFSPTGIQTRLFDSGVTYGTTQRDAFARPSDSQGMTFELGKGKIYVTLCQASAPVGSYISLSCNSTNTKIAVVPTTSQFDYPRSAAFSKISEKLKYVALGDSFSAGEGLPPFIPPSDTSNCDRSNLAYPNIATQNSTTLRLAAFVACSGTTSTDMLVGGQLTSLDYGTDVVSLTTGGNDIHFKDLAYQCVTSTCDNLSSEYQYAIDKINGPLQQDIETLLTAIEANTDAQVYVLGYPSVVPSSTTTCSYFVPTEQAAVTSVTVGLNSKIEAAVNNMGSQFHYVDPNGANSPFHGHELCSPDPYFFGLNIAEQRFSFHPNVAGQNAYANLLESAL